MKSTSTQTTFSLPTKDEVIFIPPSKRCYPFRDHEEAMLRLGAMHVYYKALSRYEGVYAFGLCTKKDGSQRSYFRRWLGLFGKSQASAFNDWFFDEFSEFTSTYTSLALSKMPYHWPSDESLISSLIYL